MAKVVVIGCGGVGGLYGGLLASGGADVTFLVRSDAEVLRSKGLRVESPLGDVDLAPGSFGATADPHEIGVADHVIVALKATANDTLARVLPPLVGPNTTVALFQNGLGAEEKVAQVVPQAAAVLAGLCFVCSSRVAPGHIVHADYGAVTIAAHTGSPEGVATMLASAGVEVTVADDITTARWLKLLWNIPYNGLTALLDAGTDEVMASPAGRAMVDALMAETVAAAQACGAAIDDQDAQKMIERTLVMTPYRTSMALDLAAGRELEIDAIYRNPAAAAEANGVSVPLIRQLAQMLEFRSRR